MSAVRTELQAAGLSAEMWGFVQPRLAAALAGLDLDGAFGVVRISADDLPGSDEAWFSLRAIPATQLGTGAETCSCLTISCHPDVFCRRAPQGADTAPPRAIWDRTAAPRGEAEIPAAEFSTERTDIFLYQQLLTVDDLRRGDLRGADIPRRLAEAFGAAWSVSVAGRLARRQLPGRTITTCRLHFSRLFAAGGILLPEHWQVFESLWHGGLSGQAAILGAVRVLPRL